jgi:hypothetical protein
MKQHLSLLVLIVVFCFACKKDNTNAENIDTALTGIWTKAAANAGTATGKESVEFSANGDIIINRYYVNPSTQQTLGYAYRYTGKYQVSGNGVVQLYNMKVLANDTADPYVAAEKLTNKGNSADQQYTYQLSSLKTVLNWTVVCPPNASCIGTQQFTKQSGL